MMMKAVLKFQTFLILMAIALLTSCQKEATQIVDETDEEEIITANSVLTQQLISASQNNGAADNILDGSSCISIGLPVTVYANGVKLTIASLSDLDQVEDIFDMLPDDDDIIQFQFPIRIVYEDYQEDDVFDGIDLTNRISNCESFIEDTYRCVGFSYPISCFTYDEDIEETGFVTLQTDQEWFEYLLYLNDDIRIAIDYGMEVIIDEAIYPIENNAELLAILADSDCEVDTIPVDPDVNEVRTIISAGLWRVSQFIDSGDDDTAVFMDYEFNFLQSGQVYATDGSNNLYGDWSVFIDDGELNFEFIMESPINDANEDDYIVLDYNADSLTLVTRASNGDVDESLVFEKL